MKNLYLVRLYSIIKILSFVFALLFYTKINFTLGFICSFFIAGIGRSGFYHRYLSHRSFETSKLWKYVGLTLGTLTLSDIIAYAAIHRDHHKFADTDKDPHSPKYINIFTVLFREEKLKASVSSVRDLLLDSDIRWFQKNSLKIVASYVAILAMCDFVFNFNFSFLVTFFVFVNVITVINTFSLVYINHTFGSQKYQMTNNSKNTWWAAIILFTGENWHNNHHKNPDNISMSEAWWQIDLVGLFCKLISIKMRDPNV
ncbi:MAG: acyl-CoA desaturase [Pseudobdellovibrio sp.]